MKRFFLRNLRQLRRVAIVSGLFVFFLLLLGAPKYKSEASFKKTASQKEAPNSMMMMFQQFIDIPNDNSAVAIMQSNTVIGKAIEEMGIQIESSRDFIVLEAFKRMRDNLKAEFGFRLADSEKFTFSNVRYSGEKAQKLFVKLGENGSYQLFDQNKQLLCEARVQQQVSTPLVQLTLSRVPSDAKADKFYSFTLNPIEKTINGLRGGLKLYTDKLDKNIMRLSFLSRDRHFGAAFLNCLMKSYQTYLKRENDAICRNQLDYLQKRQEELTGYYDKALTEHATYLDENLSRNGFIGFAQEIETLSVPKTSYTAKLFDVDLQLNRLRGAKKGWLTSKEGDKQAFQKGKDHQAHHEQKQRDALEFTHEAAGLQSQLANCEFEQMRNQASSTLEESLSADDFAGLSLDTAQGLLVEYTRQRDTLQAQMKELVFLKEQLSRSDFEMSSLGGVFDDAVTRDIVNKASAIALQLKDEDNRSTREQERLHETQRAQKEFLSHYLSQTCDLKRERIKLLGDKIATLQHAAHDLLKNEEGLLKTKLRELNAKMSDLPEKWRRESLLMLRKELGAMMIEGISQLVESKSLALHTFQISSNPLDFAVIPTVPQSRKAFACGLIAALMATLGYYFLIFSKAIFKGLPVTDEALRFFGFPVSGKVSKFCNAALSQTREEDLETLRHMAELILAKKTGGDGILALHLGGRYPNFSMPLAELLSLRHLKVVVVQAAFDKVLHPSNVPGLWQYLEGETAEIPLQRHHTFDLLHSGTTSRHGTEILNSPKAQELLSQLKQRYDVVLLSSSADPGKMEAVSLLKLADVALVTVQQERKEDLEIYFQWSEQKGSPSATFVYAEEYGR